MGNFFDRFHKSAKTYDPLGHAIAEKVTGIDKNKREAEAVKSKATLAAAEAEASGQAAADRLRVTQVDTRRQDRNQAAGAAGATRIRNDQDLLGSSAPVKRRGASSRVLLGE